jgi:hypothetical protein
MLNTTLSAIDPNTMLLGLLFVIFFVIINFALVKTIKNKGTSSIISFCVSLLAVYGINRTSLDLSGLFTGIGLSDKLIYSVIPILIIVGLGFMIWKLKLSKTLILVGLSLIILSFTPLIYTKSTILIIGIVLLIIGIILLIVSKRNKNPNTNPGNPSAIKPRKGSILWIIFILFFIVAFYGVINGFAMPVIIAGIILLVVGFIIFLKFV